MSEEQQVTSNDSLQKQVASLSQIAESQQAQLKSLEQTNQQLVTLMERQAARPQSTSTGVKIEDINMPFMNMVGLLVKIALASIPAAIILTIVYFIIAFIIASVFGGIGLLGSL